MGALGIPQICHYPSFDYTLLLLIFCYLFFFLTIVIGFVDHLASTVTHSYNDLFLFLNVPSDDPSSLSR